MKGAKPSGSADKVAIILAGGKSSRFGSDKALARIAGEPMLLRLARILESAGFDIMISTNHPERHRVLGFPMIADSSPFEGPLSALKDVMTQLKSERVFVAACDMPFLSREMAELLWREGSSFDVTILSGQGGVFPFPGVYSKNLLFLIQRLLSQERRDLKSLFAENIAIRRIPIDEWSRFASRGESHWNINTREDLPGFHF